MKTSKRRPSPHQGQLQVSQAQLQPAVRQLFSGDFLHRALASRPDKYRARILTIEVVLLALLDFLFSNLRSFGQLLDRLRLGDVQGLDPIEVSDSAFFKRLRALPHTVFLGLLRDVTEELRNRGGPVRTQVRQLAPFATGLYAIDDSTLDKLVRKTEFLKQFDQGAPETLGGRIGCALDLVTGICAEVLYDSDSEANEKNHIQPLIERLGKGALYVFDLGYFSFPLFDFITQFGSFFVSRMRQKISFKVLEVLAEGPLYRDRIIYLGAYRADCAAYPVRFVELLIGGVWYGYLTNVLDPRQLPASHVWALYQMRWTIEMAFAAIKRALEMGFLRLCHLNGVLIQVWCTLAVYQVLQGLRLEIAETNGWDEEEISWVNLMRRIAQFAQNRTNKGPDLRKWLVEKAERIYLKKRGTRERRLKELPDELLTACLPPPGPPDPEKLKPRAARQGKPNPRRKTSLVILACLS